MTGLTSILMDSFHPVKTLKMIMCIDKRHRLYGIATILLQSLMNIETHSKPD